MKEILEIINAHPIIGAIIFLLGFGFVFVSCIAYVMFKENSKFQKYLNDNIEENKRTQYLSIFWLVIPLLDVLGGLKGGVLL